MGPGPDGPDYIYIAAPRLQHYPESGDFGHLVLRGVLGGCIISNLADLLLCLKRLRFVMTCSAVELQEAHPNLQGRCNHFLSRFFAYSIDSASLGFVMQTHHCSFGVVNTCGRSGCLELCKLWWTHRD